MFWNIKWPFILAVMILKQYKIQIRVTSKVHLNKFQVPSSGRNALLTRGRDLKCAKILPILYQKVSLVPLWNQGLPSLVNRGAMVMWPSVAFPVSALVA